MSLGLFFGAAALSFGQTTNLTVTNPVLPEVSFSLFRVFGALALVVALFLGGVWLFRNWQRLAVRQGRAPKLHVLEVKSIGQRHALYVVAYEQQRLLLATSSTGVTMLTPLPDAEVNGPE